MNDILHSLKKAIMKTLLTFIALIILGNSLQAQMQLNGAGATFPYVIYSKWFDEYQKKTGIQFNYQSIGSGGGIKQVIEGTVDFGATDGPMNDVQLAEAKTKQGTDVLHIPTVLGAVVATYNVDGIGAGLKLTPDVLADIFLGKITQWNDARIAASNKGVSLPAKPIVVVHRSDGSGTTYIFVDYLSKVSPEWNSSVGVGTSVKWPIGLGGKGNEGVAGQVKQIDGSIGYVELAYAVKNGLSFATLKNKAGNFIVPSLESVTAAAMSEAKKLPEDLRVSITDAAGKDSYPISGFTWLLIYKDQKNADKAKAMVNFLKWAFTEGEKFAPALYYAPLPKAVIALNQKKIASIRFDGKPVK
jgi:phosphate transport system substrate-binding protein